MKLWPTSDQHYEYGNMVWPAPEHDIQVVAGDLNEGDMAVRSLAAGRGPDAAIEAAELGREPPRPCIFVPGNHEYWSTWRTMENLDREMSYWAHRAPLLHVLNPGVAVVAGVRFVGATCWTDYQLFGAATQEKAMTAAAEGMNDHRFISVERENGKGSRRFTPRDALALHHRDLAFICETLAQPFDGPTVVVTHSGPSFRSVPERFDEDLTSAAFSSRLDWVCEKYAPALWIHGHTHDSMDYTIGATRVICNPAGYQHQPNKAFRPGLVIDLEVPDPEPTKGFGL